VGSCGKMGERAFWPALVPVSPWFERLGGSLALPISSGSEFSRSPRLSRSGAFVRQDLQRVGTRRPLLTTFCGETRNARPDNPFQPWKGVTT
jgi:hypothetical protein